MTDTAVDTAKPKRRPAARPRMTTAECQERIRAFLVEHHGDGVAYNPHNLATALGLPHSSVNTAIKRMLKLPTGRSFDATRDMPRVWKQLDGRLPAVPETEPAVHQNHSLPQNDAGTNGDDGMIDDIFFVPAGHIGGRPVVRDPDGALYEIRKIW